MAAEHTVEGRGPFLGGEWVAGEGELTVHDLAEGGELARLSAAITADAESSLAAAELAERIDAGAVRINGAPSHGIGDVPFGDTGASGIGRQGIGYTIESFLERKSIVL